MDRQRSLHRTASTENDVHVQIDKPQRGLLQSIEYERLDTDEEEVFTDLRACEEPIDSDGDSSRASSPTGLDGEGPVQICAASYPKAKHASSSSSSNSFSLQSYDELLNLLRNDPYRFIFYAVPKEMTKYLHCRIMRGKGVDEDMFYLDVEFDGDDNSITLLMAQRRRKTVGQSQYSISLNPHFNYELCPTELTAMNLTGTEYVLQTFTGDQPQQLASIQYESNFLGLKGPRKTTVLIPRFDQHREPFFDEDDLEEFCSKDWSAAYLHLCNKTPLWSTESGTYVIQFEGDNRVVIPSVKNFQMVIEKGNHEQHVVMEFGRKSNSIFSCDFRYPLSFAQAFSIGLTAFETRLFRE